MPPPNESLSASSLVIGWRRALPFLSVFVATFLLIGMQWPATSPGVRATVSVDFCLPPDIESLSQREAEFFKSLVQNQVSAQLSGQKFDSLIWQTKRSGKTVSSSIEYSDQEVIRSNFALGFDFQPECGRLQIEYICEGQPDQSRFLQLIAHQVATSIDSFYLSTDTGIAQGNNLDLEKLDRAMWLANRIQTHPNGIRNTDSTSPDQPSVDIGNPYLLASARRISPGHLETQLGRDTEGHNNLTGADALIGVLNEIKSQAITPESSDVTFSVLKVSPVQSRAIGATPDRWAMLRLLAMASVVTGLVAMFHTVPLANTNVDTLSQSLGIPVVAVLTTGSKTKQSVTNADVLSAAAKSLMIVSKIFLLVTAVVVIGFVLLDSSIRESFFQNPFDGLAKIFGVFFSNA